MQDNYAKLQLLLLTLLCFLPSVEGISDKTSIFDDFEKVIGDFTYASIIIVGEDHLYSAKTYQLIEAVKQKRPDFALHDLFLEGVQFNRNILLNSPQSSKHLRALCAKADKCESWDDQEGIKLIRPASTNFKKIQMLNEIEFVFKQLKTDGKRYIFLEESLERESDLSKNCIKKIGYLNEDTYSILESLINSLLSRYDGKSKKTPSTFAEVISETYLALADGACKNTSSELLPVCYAEERIAKNPANKARDAALINHVETSLKKNRYAIFIAGRGHTNAIIPKLQKYKENVTVLQFKQPGIK